MVCSQQEKSQGLKLQIKISKPLVMIICGKKAKPLCSAYISKGSSRKYNTIFQRTDWSVDGGFVRADCLSRTETALHQVTVDLP